MGFTLRLSRRFRVRRLLPLNNAARFARATRANAAVEFAIIGPVLLLMMTGILTYGGYFLTAHTVQQIANDAARAAIGGLDDAERAALARQAADVGLANQGFMRGQFSALGVSREGEAIAVSLTYDASEDLYWTFASVIPTPSPAISRTATIRVGGF